MDSIVEDQLALVRASATEPVDRMLNTQRGSEVIAERHCLRRKPKRDEIISQIFGKVRGIESQQVWIDQQGRVPCARVDIARARIEPVGVID